MQHNDMHTQQQIALLETENKRLNSLLHSFSQLHQAQLFQLTIPKGGAPYFSFLSEGINQWYAHTATALVAKSELLFSSVVAEDIEPWLKAIEQAAHNIKPLDHTVRLKHQNGNIHWHRYLGQPRIENNTVVFDGIDIDVTELKTAEANLQKSKSQLAQSNNLLSAILKNTHVMVAFMDTDFNFIWVNEPYADANGKTPDFFVGKNHFELYPHTENEAIFKQVAQTGNSYIVHAKPFDHPATPERGTTYWDWSLAPVKNDQNKVTNLVLTLSDVTEATKNKQTIEEKRQRLDNIVNSAHDAIISINTKHEIILFNKAAEHIFGYEQSEAVGISINILIPQRFHHVHSTHIHNYDKSGVNLRDMYEFKAIYGMRSNGEEFPIEAAISQTGEGNDKIFTVIVRDISERLKMEKTLRENAENLQKLNETKDRFFSIISHDLKNPFNVLMGFSDLLVKNASFYTPQKVEQFAKTIHKTSSQTYELLVNLLEWSRIQTGALAANPKAININNFIENTKQLCQPLAMSKNIHLVCDVQHKEYEIFADAEMTKTVLRNLVTNAIKFTNANGIVTVSTKIQDNEMIFSVADTGIGIEPDMIDKLFRIGKKISKHGTANETGSGLGLILCKEFVENNHGRIWVQSEVGKGTTFFFTLPLHNEEVQPHNAMDKVTVLVADDDYYSYCVIEEVLREWHFDIIHAYNGKEVIEKCNENNNVSIILMDIRMPGIDGYTAAKVIRQQHPRIKIIAQSAYEFQNDDKYPNLFDGVLRKPLNKDELIQKVKGLVHNLVNFYLLCFIMPL